MIEGFRTSQISRLLNVTPATVVNWINKGKLPAYMTLGGHYRVMRKDLITLMEKEEIPVPDELRTPEELKAKKYRILIVDDEENVIESVKLNLENIGVDVEIETATNGVIAGIELTEFKPHLVILDAIMPGADGDVVLKEIRKKQILKDIKVLVYTGYPDEGKKLLELGADKLIEKYSKDDDMENFQREVCRLLGVKSRKVIPKIIS